MCGIYGVINSSEPINLDLLNISIASLKHRGPNDSGTWVSTDGKVGIAHRRLSIIDLSRNAHQPMCSADGHYVIVFNGEIYNFIELRSELEKLGYIFRGGSDTEVILAGYQAWGTKCLERFNGMFAFALYDSATDPENPIMFLARDRVGKKPLYYSADRKSFKFASEPKALEISDDINLHALNYYLALGYVPHDLCLFSGVKKLPPAHAMILNISNLDFKIWKYWSLPESTLSPVPDTKALVDEVENLFMDSVKLRMISDVPLGVLLSGGLDSSLIAVAAAKQSLKPIKTFTIAFPGTKYDEAVYANCITKHINAEHHVLEVNKTSLSVLDELKDFIDEPIADSSILPTFIVSKLAKEHVSVALSGDGGDELFGGYSTYQVALKDQHNLRNIPTPLLNYISRLARLLPAGLKGRNKIASLKGGALQQTIWGSPYFDVELRRRVFNPEQLKILGADIDAPERWLLSLFLPASDPIDSMTRMDFGSILPDDFLVKVDRASMMNSLEVRCPLLDYRLVETAFGRIPRNLKVKCGETRIIQKLLGKRLLPAGLDLNRKQGFSIPMDEWLRTDNCNIIKEHIKYLPQSINLKEVLSLIDGQMRGRANGSRLYALLMLAFALRKK